MADPKQAFANVIARAWADDAFKARLLAEPEATLRGAGVTVPEGMKIDVVENTATHVTLVIPRKPESVLFESGGPSSD